MTPRKSPAEVTVVTGAARKINANTPKSKNNTSGRKLAILYATRSLLPACAGAGFGEAGAELGAAGWGAFFFSNE